MIPFDIDGRTTDVFNNQVLRVALGKSHESKFYTNLVRHSLSGVDYIEIPEDEELDTHLFDYIRTFTALFKLRVEISVLTYASFQFLNRVSFVDGFVVRLHDGIQDNNEAFYDIMFSMLDAKREQSYCILPEDLPDEVVDRSLNFLSMHDMKAIALG